jgi:hypothetical protein
VLEFSCGVPFPKPAFSGHFSSPEVEYRIFPDTDPISYLLQTRNFPEQSEFSGEVPFLVPELSCGDPFPKPAFSGHLNYPEVKYRIFPAYWCDFLPSQYGS